MSNALVPQNFKSKSFWERPEGVAGMIVGSGLLIGGGYGLYHLLPYLITMMRDTLHLAFLTVAVGAVLMVMTDKRFWTLGSYFYQSLMRTITGWFVTIDPIGILKSYVSRLKDQLTNIDNKITRLAGMKRKLENEIETNDHNRRNALDMAQQAQKKGATTELTLQSRQAGRLQDTNANYQKLLAKITLLYEVLLKYQEASNMLIQDMEAEIDLKAREREMSREAHSAIRSAMAILKSGTTGKEIYDQAMEYLAHDYGMKIGEIEDFVRRTESFLTSIDLQNGMYEERALTMLNDLEAHEGRLLTFDPQNGTASLSQVLAAGRSQGATANWFAPAPSSRPSSTDGRTTGKPS